MDRRKFLALVGSSTFGGLAGCPAAPGASPTATERTTRASSTPSPVPTDSPTTRPDQTASPTTTEEAAAETSTEGTPTEPSNSSDLQRYVSIEDVDSVPPWCEVEMNLELVRSRVTDTETALLRLTTRNTGSPRSISVSADKCRLLNRAKAGSDQPEGLWLHSPQNAESIPRDGDRWEAARDSDGPRAYDDYGCGMREYAAGESVSNEYVLWDDYRVEGYMEQGTYRWEEKISVSEQETSAESSGERAFTWGFSLELGIAMPASG
jgi:hypothetical protein